MDSTQQGNTTTPVKTMSKWDKVKALFRRIKASVIAFFTTSAAWLKNMFNNRPWFKYAVIVAVIMSLAGGMGYWRDRQLTRNINMLETQVQIKAEQIKVVEAERDEIKAQYEALKKQIMATQVKNDSNIKEAGKHAYQKASNIPDSDVLRNFNLLIDSARKRNTNR